MKDLVKVTKWYGLEPKVRVLLESMRKMEFVPYRETCILVKKRNKMFGLIAK